MVISDFLKERLKDIFSKERVPRDDSLDPRDDFETRDKSLRALRRMRRRQIDVIERKQLTKVMDDFKQRKNREDFIGESSFNSTLSGGTRKPKKVKQGFMGRTKFF